MRAVERSWNAFLLCIRPRCSCCCLCLLLAHAEAAAAQPQSSAASVPGDAQMVLVPKAGEDERQYVAI